MCSDQAVTFTGNKLGSTRKKHAKKENQKSKDASAVSWLEGVDTRDLKNYSTRYVFKQLELCDNCRLDGKTSDVALLSLSPHL